jgi:hypothetical protein
MGGDERVSWDHFESANACDLPRGKVFKVGTPVIAFGNPRSGGCGGIRGLRFPHGQYGLSEAYVNPIRNEAYSADAGRV